jgi:hypothetical protein
LQFTVGKNETHVISMLLLALACALLLVQHVLSFTSAPSMQFSFGGKSTEPKPLSASSRVALGDLQISPMGIGCWAWGNKLVSTNFMNLDCSKA